MELNERKRAILAAVIKSYIERGEPIGSKALCDVLDLSLSSATLRNEMSDLCELGYLEQPHTSAGRIPTALGYKLYISDLMNQAPVSSDMKLIIDSKLEGLCGDVDEITLRASDCLSDMLRLPVIISSQSDERNTVKRIELLSMGRRLLFAVLITSNGMVKNRMLHLSGELSPETAAKFQSVCEEYIIGRPLSEMTRTHFQTVAMAGGISLMSLNAALFEMIEESKNSQFSLRGESNIFHCFGHSFESRGLIDLLSQKERMLSLLSQVEEPVGVIFGNDTGIDEFRSSTLVVAKYKAGENTLGHIGVVCPMRIGYEWLIPSVEYFAKRMSKAINETLTDLED